MADNLILKYKDSNGNVYSIPQYAVDSVLSTKSTNAVMNKTVAQALNNAAITVDSELSTASENPVQNKVVTEALNNVIINVDSELSSTSENPVQNKVITDALNNIPTPTDELVEQQQCSSVNENRNILSRKRAKCCRSGARAHDAGL